MNEITIDTMQNLIARFNACPNSMMFRGQSNAEYNLSSSLERLLGVAWSPQQAIRFEDYSLTRFRSKYHLYDKGLRKQTNGVR